MNSKIGRTAANEPVVLAGMVRAMIYSFLGTRVDPATLATIVVVAEAVTGYFLRRYVTPLLRKDGPGPSDPPAEPPAAIVEPLEQLAA